MFFNAPLSHLIMWLLKSSYEYHFTLSGKAFVFTSLSFGLFYLFGLIGALSAINTKTIKQLLRPVNEYLIFQRKRYTKAILLVVSIIVLALGLSLVIIGFCNDQEAGFLFLSAFLLIFTGLFMFYRNSSVIIIKLLSLFHKRRYKSINNYFYGQMCCKSILHEKQNALLAVLTMIALGTLSLSLAMTNIFYVNMETFYPYDLEVLFDADISSEEMQKLQQYVLAQTSISDSRIYNLYKTDDEVCIMGLSDYNFLRRQIGLDNKQLDSDQFIVHCEERRYLDDIFKRINEDSTLNIGDINLTTSTSLVFTEAMEQAKTAGSNGYVVVVPDQFTNKVHIWATRLVMMGDNIPVTMKKMLEDYIVHEWSGQKELDAISQNHIFYDVIVKSWNLQNSMAGYGMIAFGGLYLSITILILLGAVISFQQLSLSEERRMNYKILISLGISWKEWLLEIKKEIIAKFLISAIMPLFITIVLLTILQLVYGPYLLTDKKVIFLSGLIALGIFLVIYCVYLFLVYLTCYYIMKKQN